MSLLTNKQLTHIYVNKSSPAWKYYLNSIYLPPTFHLCLNIFPHDKQYWP